MKDRMFRPYGIDITNDRQMFNYLKNHFTYSTLNSWNCLESIANNVKLYNLKLSGDWTKAYAMLISDDYFTVNMMLEDWAAEHPGYSVGFNGRSDGYLVLYNENNNGTILPYIVDQSDTYEDYKEYCRDYYGSVKAARPDLRETTKLVLDFDKLCDDIRDYCDQLSTLDPAAELMTKAVDDFNNQEEADLAELAITELVVNKKSVNISALRLQCLLEAFTRILYAYTEPAGYGYQITDNICSVISKF